MAGGMKHTGASISHMRNDGNQSESIHKLHSCCTVALQTKGDDTTTAVGQVFLCQLVALVTRKTAVVNPSHTIVGFQEFCYLLGILTMAWHTQMQRFQS